MARTLSSVIVTALLMQAAPVLAETTPIAVDSAADWPHASSGIVLPHRAGPFTRLEVEDFGHTRSDLGITYADSASETVATVYIFRAGLISVPVWHDRITRTVISYSDTYGTLDLARAVDTRFALPRSKVKNAQRTVAPLSGRGFRSTGIAVIALDDWLVTARITSRSLAVPKLDAALVTVIASLTLPKVRSEAPEVYALSDCLIVLPAKSATRKPATLDEAVVSSISSFVPVNPGRAIASSNAIALTDGDTSRPFCRMPGGDASSKVYAQGDGKDGFVIAFGDSGIAAVVARDAAAAPESRRAGFSLTEYAAGNVLSFRGFYGLPSVEQVREALVEERPIGGRDRLPATEQAITTTLHQ